MMSGYQKIALIIIKDTDELKKKDKKFKEHIQEFETGLGESLKHLGSITHATKRIKWLSCDSSSVSHFLCSCLPCVEKHLKKYEVLAISCRLEELEAAAEACGLLVPIAKVKGLFPKPWDRHPVLHYINTYFNCTSSTTINEDDAKHYFKKQIKDKFKIEDPHTKTTFTSGQCYLLTAAHLNNEYNKFKKEYHKKERIDPHLMNSTVYKEGFVLHDQSEAEELADKWKYWGSPPLKQVRAYLGEKVGFSLAWKDCWVKWGLILPSILGFISISYGLSLVGIGKGTPSGRGKRGKNFSINTNDTIVPFNGSLTDDMIAVLDNELVPYYALFMCIWHVICYIRWQRAAKLLQFEWGVSGFTLKDELERPGYHKSLLVDVFEENELGESQKVKCIRTLRKILSFVVVLSLLILVVVAFLLSLYVKFKLREVLGPDRSISSDPIMYWIFDAEIIAQIASGSTSAVCIFTLRQVFNHASYKLTIFENHMFESDFERSLTWKLFAMDFINTHFYNILVMFFRNLFDEGIFNIPADKCDLCMQNDCIAAVSINVFMMLFLGFVMDQFALINYCIRNMFASTPILKNNIPMTELAEEELNDEESQPLSKILKQVEKEFHFIDETLPGDTNSSYDRDYSTLVYMLRKMQKYSVVVMYAAACPLAPLIVLVIELLNNIRDRRRYTGHLFRRPIAQRTDGIGHWLSIQSLVNLIALTSNAFIIAIRSTHGKQLFGINWNNYYEIIKSTKCDPCDDLMIVRDKGLWVLCLWLIVIMALLTHALTNYFDYIPVYIKVAMRKQKYAVNKVLDDKND